MVSELFQTCGVAFPKPAVVCSSMELYWKLLATSGFIAIMPRSLLRFGIQCRFVRVLPIQLEVRPRPVAIVTQKKRVLSPAAQLLIRCMEETTDLLSETAVEAPAPSLKLSLAGR